MSFKKVRNAHRTENTEDYLELIADLLNENGEARIVDVAEKLDAFLFSYTCDFVPQAQPTK